ncbi:hypothetical protein AA0117_g11772 [Alternaria alternata]|uniref:Uncharacterized protein n=1 Tax=Alternaria alternata TaxID=5599 RepID=A0A4Q4N2G0_ALTAL|nr:hypothetical protein AA0117_g11772 [Alternaria alternata]
MTLDTEPDCPLFDYRTTATNTAAHSRSRFQTDKQ